MGGSSRKRYGVRGSSVTYLCFFLSLLPLLLSSTDLRPQSLCLPVMTEHWRLSRDLPGSHCGLGTLTFSFKAQAATGLSSPQCSQPLRSSPGPAVHEARSVTRNLRVSSSWGEPSYTFEMGTFNKAAWHVGGFTKVLFNEFKNMYLEVSICSQLCGITSLPASTVCTLDLRKECKLNS